MESYQLSFNATPTGAKKNLPASGDLFVYESASVATGAETRIKVKPSNGNTIILKPGQRFRNPDPVTDWAMESYNGNDVIDAVFIIGFGEFDDANTLNKFTLDATLTNNVTVTNTPASRVPVTLDTNQLLKLDPNNSISSAAPVMAYTNAKSNISLAASAATNLVTAAENVNGVIIEQVVHNLGQGGTLLAKATVPGTGAYDGEVLAGLAAAVSGPTSVTQRIKVAAGKGVWLWNMHGSTIFVGNVLYTVL
jgi:hypothetical protein